MDLNECAERIRLTDVYGRFLAEYNSSLDALKRSPGDQYHVDSIAAEAALEASQRAWDALAQHIAQHQCLDVRWSGSESGGGHILGQAAAAALDIILVADDDRRFVDVNEAATGILGLSRNEIVGRRIDEFFTEARGEAIPKVWEHFVSEGVQSGICELRAAGQPRLFEYRAKANFAPGLHVSVLRERPS